MNKSKILLAIAIVSLLLSSFFSVKYALSCSPVTRHIALWGSIPQNSKGIIIYGNFSDAIELTENFSLSTYYLNKKNEVEKRKVAIEGEKLTYKGVGIDIWAIRPKNKMQQGDVYFIKSQNKDSGYISDKLLREDPIFVGPPLKIPSDYSKKINVIENRFDVMGSYYNHCLPYTPEIASTYNFFWDIPDQVFKYRNYLFFEALVDDMVISKPRNSYYSFEVATPGKIVEREKISKQLYTECNNNGVYQGGIKPGVHKIKLRISLLGMEGVMESEEKLVNFRCPSKYNIKKE